MSKILGNTIVSNFMYEPTNIKKPTIHPISKISSELPAKAQIIKIRKPVNKITM